MSTVAKKTVHFKIDGKDATAPEGTVILEAAKRLSEQLGYLPQN